MGNELRKNTGINIDLQIGSFAAFGIATLAATSLCLCIHMGMKYGYTFHLGTMLIAPNDNLLAST